MDRYICVHGHFYQPPRENPWLEAIELQDSAYPYHDWNQRITAECYAPNGASRILDERRRIRKIVNNYAKISFNFGPTLLAWLEHESPEVYAAVLAANAESSKLYSGHGSAMAQAYNHVILPLANERDKRTQVLWGIHDFEHRFGRKPEGFWLPETAVDLETLDILAEAGLKFTVLSPHQAGKVRSPGSRIWRDVSGGRVDPSMAYRVRLKSGRSLALFFYDGPISKAVAFEDLLERGENLANRLCQAFSGDRNWPQLVHIATDGETYGHHRHHADMALAYALHHIETNHLAKLTNYGEFLERHPPGHEVQIVENTSWSCIHGIERWRSNCGCNSGMRPEWNQQWRAPLRDALDWLRDKLAVRFEEAGRHLFRNPWHARDEYINVLLDRSNESTGRFLDRHAISPLLPEQRIHALKLLELQRHAMLMYTSCGWFFDELSGIETVQVIQYASRAVQLGQELFGNGLESGFVSRLENAVGNLPEHHNGAVIYQKFVKPAMVDLEKVGAHYAISSLFEEYPQQSRIYSYEVRCEDFQSVQEGKTKLVLGRAQISSRVTGESTALSFGALHLGDQNVSGGVRAYRGEDAYRSMIAEVREVFLRGDIPELIRAVDRNFGGGTYSLRLLFRDEQRKIVGQVLDKALAEAEILYRSFYGQYATLARFITDLAIPLPARFRMAVDFTLHEDLLRVLSADEPDAERLRGILEQVRRTGILLDHVTLEFAYRQAVERAAAVFRAAPEDQDLLDRFLRVVSLCELLPFQVNLWQAQNIYDAVRKDLQATMEQEVARGDLDAQAWLDGMGQLGERLGFFVEKQIEGVTD